MKFINVAKKYGSKLAVGTGLVAATPLAMAAGTAPDYSAITGAVDYSAISTAVITILSAVAVCIVAYNGGKMLISAIRGARA